MQCFGGVTPQDQVVWAHLFICLSFIQRSFITKIQGPKTTTFSFNSPFIHSLSKSSINSSVHASVGESTESIADHEMNERQDKTTPNLECFQSFRGLDVRNVVDQVGNLVQDQMKGSLSLQILVKIQLRKKQKLIDSAI